MKFPAISRLVLCLAIVGTIGCDRVTKHIAEVTLAGQPSQTWLAGTVWLGYVQNTAGFLSLGVTWPVAVRTAVFTFGTGLMLLVLGVAAIRLRPTGWMAMGFALFLAGAASNWFDRVVQGSVVDFLNVGIGSLRTGIFNVADVAILAGAALSIWADVRKSSGHTNSGGSDVDVQQVS
jgi:signal peptidase II